MGYKPWGWYLVGLAVTAIPTAVYLYAVRSRPTDALIFATVGVVAAIGTQFMKDDGG